MSMPGPQDSAIPDRDSTVQQLARLMESLLPKGEFSERERAALELANEVTRRVLEKQLQDLATELGGAVEVDGKLYKPHEEATVPYHSLCGPLEVTRPTARMVGIHNGPTIVPVELAAGIGHHCTPALAAAIAHGYARTGSRELRREMLSAHRAPPSRATIERVASTFAREATESSERIVGGLRRTEEVPPNATAVVLGIDRVSVPMKEALPAEKSQAEPPRKKPRLRRLPAPHHIVYRMAYVATVSFVDADGSAIEVKRYAAPACDDPTKLVEAACADIRHACAKAQLHVGVVQDGAPELWNLSRRGLAPLIDDGAVDTVFEGIDRCHLMGHLNSALEALGVKSDERHALLDEWKLSLDTDYYAIDRIETWLRESIGAASKKRADDAAEHLTYVSNNKDRMRYVLLRTHGLPVGSGVTESTAKTVVNARTKRSGQRWTESGLRGVLALRALLQSNRLDDFWVRHARRYVANVQCIAA